MSGDFDGLAIDAARRHLSHLLRAHAIDTPDLDARLLLGAALGLDLTGLAKAAARRLAPQDAARLAGYAQRRIAGEPVARILGVKEFWGLALQLSATTLVPRPDTETVVDAALQMMGPPARKSPLRIADIGTGTGALLLALLSEWPHAFGVGSDIDEQALRMAAANARRLNLADRAAFVTCNYTEALQGPFDLIVSNPPYIPTQEIAALAAEVRDHDPRRALDGGTDGLDAYRILAPEAVRLLAPEGMLLVEVGQNQADEVEELMAAAGLERLPRRADLAGIPRVVTGRKQRPQGPPGQ